MQNMFIATLKYVKPIAEVDALLQKHREHLLQFLHEGKLLIAGKLQPRTGGVIIAKNVSRDQFEQFLKDDPFAQAKVSEYQIIEFIPGLHDSVLSLQEGENQK
jgi:uncharacterized protein YciI